LCHFRIAGDNVFTPDGVSIGIGCLGRNFSLTRT